MRRLMLLAVLLFGVLNAAYIESAGKLSIDTLSTNTAVKGQNTTITVKGEGFSPKTTAWIGLDSGNRRQMIGSLETFNASHVVINSDGTKAFLADGQKGLLIIDIHDLSSPFVLGAFDTKGTARHVSLSADGSKAVVADGDNGVVILDVKIPSSPVEIATYSTDGSVRSTTLTKDGKMMVVAKGQEGIAIIDVSNITQPATIGDFDTEGFAHTAVLNQSETVAFIADDDAGLVILDISDPSRPKKLGGLDTVGWVESISLSQDESMAYLADGDTGLAVVDVNDVANPTLIKNLFLDGYAHQIVLDAKKPRAFVANSDAGLVVVDISAPKSPEVSGKIETSGKARSVALGANGLKALLADGNAGLAVIDVSTPVAANVFGKLKLEGGARDIVIDEVNALAFMARGTEGLSIIDVSNPSRLHEMRTLKFGAFVRSVSLSQDKTKALVADGSDAVHIVDIAHPEAATSLGSIPIAASFAAFSQDGSIAYLAANDAGLAIVDIAQPDTPKTLSSIETDGYALHIALDHNAKTAYVANSAAGLAVFDVSEPSSPKKLASFDTSGNANTVRLSADGKTAYLSNGVSGLLIVDVQHPDKPKVISKLATPSWTESITVDAEEKTAYLSIGTDGVMAVDIANPAKPEILGAIYSNHAKAATQYQNALFIADQDIGLVAQELYYPQYHLIDDETFAVTFPAYSALGYYTIFLTDGTDNYAYAHGAVSLIEKALEEKIVPSRLVLNVLGGEPDRYETNTAYYLSALLKYSNSSKILDIFNELSPRDYGVALSDPEAATIDGNKIIFNKPADLTVSVWARGISAMKDFKIATGYDNNATDLIIAVDKLASASIYSAADYTAYQVYKTFKVHHPSDESIRYFKGYRGIEAYNRIDDGPMTKEIVDAYSVNDHDILQAVHNAGKSDNPLYLFLMTRQKTGALQFGASTLSAEALDDALDAFQLTNSRPVVVIVDADHAGDYARKLENTQHQRTVIASTNKTNARFGMSATQHTVSTFSERFCFGLHRGHSIYEAFAEAQKDLAVTPVILPEMPDQIPNALSVGKTDISIGDPLLGKDESTQTGCGMTLNHDFDTTGIKELTLSAKVDLDMIQEGGIVLSAILEPPQDIIAGDEALIVNSDRVEMQLKHIDTNGFGCFGASYDFAEAGIYVVTYVVENIDGNGNSIGSSVFPKGIITVGDSTQGIRIVDADDNISSSGASSSASASSSDPAAIPQEIISGRPNDDASALIGQTLDIDGHLFLFDARSKWAFVAADESFAGYFGGTDDKERLEWTLLQGYGEMQFGGMAVDMNSGSVFFGIATSSSPSDAISALASQSHAIVSHCAHYGKGAFDWICVGEADTQVLKLEGAKEQVIMWEEWSALFGDVEVVKSENKIILRSKY